MISHKTKFLSILTLSFFGLGSAFAQTNNETQGTGAGSSLSTGDRNAF